VRNGWNSLSTNATNATNVLKQAEGTNDAAVAEDVQRKYVRDDMETDDKL
jgi:hypothetical protein